MWTEGLTAEQIITLQVSTHQLQKTQDECGAGRWRKFHQPCSSVCAHWRQTTITYMSPSSRYNKNSHHLLPQVNLLLQTETLQTIPLTTSPPPPWLCRHPRSTLGWYAQSRQAWTVCWRTRFTASGPKWSGSLWTCLRSKCGPQFPCLFTYTHTDPKKHTDIKCTC